ncbi:hypothetical protein FQR65_LT18996 [Abscondita terminalis]|nr:hypothetical protein FQR65_LT18996 [Abscondita terminalis]
MFNFKIDHEYSVVQFINMSKCRDEEVFSVVPSSWLTTDGYCFWPKTNVRYCIVKYKPPSRDWEKHAVELYGRYGTYEQALRKERKLSNYSSDSNSTESEMLGRGLRKKKVSNISEEHSDVESDEKGMRMKIDNIPSFALYMFLDESDSSIPLPVSGYGELANIPGDKRNDQEAIICTDIIQPVINNGMYITNNSEGIVIPKKCHIDRFY